jgi:hypothetical protein
VRVVSVRQDGRMAIRLITGPANSGKAQVVMDVTRAHLARGTDPLLIVPTRADAEHYARELAGEGAVIGARVERFAGLAREIVRRTAVDGQLLDGVARERMLAALAERAGLGAAAPGYTRALGELFAELQTSRITPGRFAAALASWAAADGEDPARARLGRVYSAYRQALDDAERLDAEQRTVAALDRLRERPFLWGDPPTPVLFYGFDDLTALQLDAIETLGRLVGAEVTVSLAYEPGRTAFAGRAGTYEELRPLAVEVTELSPRAEHYAPASRMALGHLERSLFEPGARRVEAGGAVRLLEGGGERAELELVADEIAALIAGGMSPEEIAVMARPPIAGSALLEEVFAAAAVPVAQLLVTPFGDSGLGAALLGLLRCAEAEGEDAVGETGDLLSWLRAPGVLDLPVLADRFEVLARRRGVTGAQAARALWESRHWPLDGLERLAEAAGRGPLALLDHTGRELLRLFSAPRRRSAGLLGAAELQDAAALAAGRRALAQLHDLARLAPGLAPGTPAELAATLARIELIGGGRTAPGAVSILDPLALRARRVRALFVCGLQEGVFPARGRPRALLGDDERTRLAVASGLRLGRSLDTLAAERYLLYAAVSRPEELLVLSWHVADDDGEPSSRSLFVDDVCDLFAGDLLASRRRRALGAVERPAGEGEGEGEQAPPSRADLRIRDERLLAELRARPWSASSLERWLGCPVRWYVERMLDPAKVEPDAEPLARGGLAHAALKDTLEGLRSATGSARPRRGNLALARELLERALRENEARHALSVSPQRRAAVGRRLRADLERYLARAAEAPGELEPAELEVGFGFEPEDERGEGATLPALELGDGARMRGRIDRVDLAPSGDAVVIDYKSGYATPVAKWRESGNLQLALYMLAVEQLLSRPARAGLYQSLSGNLQARGAIDAEAGLELDSVSTDEISPEELRETLQWAAATARDIAGAAARGELEARPQTCAFRGGCSYPAICRCGR